MTTERQINFGVELRDEKLLEEYYAEDNETDCQYCDGQGCMDCLGDPEKVIRDREMDYEY